MALRRTRGAVVCIESEKAPEAAASMYGPSVCQLPVAELKPF